MTSQLLILSFAAKNLKLHWLRSLLAVIGIVIGVLSIGYMGMTQHVDLLKSEDEYAKLDNYLVLPAYQYDAKKGIEPFITERQVIQIRHAVPDHEVIPLYQTGSPFDIKIRDENAYGSVYGISPNDILSLSPLALGTIPRSVSDVVIGSDFALQTKLDIGSVLYLVRKKDTGDEVSTHRVVGVFPPLKKISLQGLDSSVFPYEPWLHEHAEFKGYDPVLIKLSDVYKMNESMEAIKKELNSQHSVVQIADPNQDRDQMLRQMENQAAQTFAIAGISLIVAGVAIFNVMVMSVMERYREIGVLRSIGTRRMAILSMFIYEALLLGFTGSAIGGLLGFFLAYLEVNMIDEMKFFFEPSSLIQIPYAMSFGIAISLISGIYPAWKASRLNPIEALRNE